MRARRHSFECSKEEVVSRQGRSFGLLWKTCAICYEYMMKL